MRTEKGAKGTMREWARRTFTSVKENPRDSDRDGSACWGLRQLSGQCAKFGLHIVARAAFDSARAQPDYPRWSRYRTACNADDAAAPRAGKSPDQRTLALVDCRL